MYICLLITLFIAQLFTKILSYPDIVILSGHCYCSSVCVYNDVLCSVNMYNNLIYIPYTLKLLSVVLKHWPLSFSIVQYCSILFSCCVHWSNYIVKIIIIIFLSGIIIPMIDVIGFKEYIMFNYIVSCFRRVSPI